jgi:lipopolysaccharide biosynthesis glycosyltransferase
MNQARISKMDIFDYSEIANYEKILYLDADSLVLRDLTCVFDVIQTDKIHAHQEGTVLGGVYWGDYLFLKENPNYINTEALSVNALGFKNLPEHKKTFAKIKQAFYLDMYQNKLQFYDQPHLNFHLIHNGLAELDAFKPLIQNRSSAEYAVKTSAAVVHMAGCPGHANVKIDLCRDFMRDYERIIPTVSENKCCPTCGKPLDA